MVKEIKTRLKDILIELREWLDVQILEGAIAQNHVHMYLSVPPKYSPAHVIKVFKEKNAERPRKTFPELCKKYGGLHIWAREYFVCTVGIDRDTIHTYVIKQQDDQIVEEQLRLWKDDGK